MIAHVLGLVTVTSTGLAAVWLSAALWRAGTRPWSWQHKVPVPKMAKQSPTLSPGSDYVGLV